MSCDRLLNPTFASYRPVANMSITYENARVSFTFSLEKSRGQMCISNNEGHLHLNVFQVAALDCYIRNEQNTHLGCNMYIKEIDNDKLILQTFAFDTEKDCLIPCGPAVTMCKEDIEFALSIFHPYYAVITPCFQTHMQGNQEDFVECSVCNPNYFLKKYLDQP